MRNVIGMAALAAVVCGPAMVSAPAQAQTHHYDHHNDRNYHGRSHYSRHRCSGGNGAVGTVAGGVGGAVLGSAVGGGTLGTVAGGVGGALLGRHFDKQHTKDKHGC
jgi:hypothetical protein